MARRRKSRGRSASMEIEEEAEYTLKFLWGIVAWTTGLLVALAVAFGMIFDTLIVPFVPPIVMHTAGWIVAVLSLLGVVLAVLDRVGR